MLSQHSTEQNSQSIRRWNEMIQPFSEGIIQLLEQQELSEEQQGSLSESKVRITTATTPSNWVHQELQFLVYSVWWCGGSCNPNLWFWKTTLLLFRQFLLFKQLNNPLWKWLDHLIPSSYRLAILLSRVLTQHISALICWVSTLLSKIANR